MKPCDARDAGDPKMLRFDTALPAGGDAAERAGSGAALRTSGGDATAAGAGVDGFIGRHAGGLGSAAAADSAASCCVGVGVRLC